MTTEADVGWEYWWKNGWPGGLASLLMISTGFLLRRWLPLHFAMAIAGFASGIVLSLIYSRRSPPKYGIPVWLAASVTGLATGLCLGLLSYYFPY
jgi:FtsH-binding integral membrane protein